MSLSDPLGDMLTRIRNAQRARQSRCIAPASRLRANVRGRCIMAVQDAPATCRDSAPRMDEKEDSMPKKGNVWLPKIRKSNTPVYLQIDTAGGLSVTTLQEPVGDGDKAPVRLLPL